MKKIVMALVGLVFASVPAFAARICIDSRNVVSSKSTDGKTLVFKMKDGTTLVNHLQGICTDLRYNGFVWVLPSGDTQVCEYAQSFRVIQSGEVCTLGKFDPPMMEKHASN